MLQIMPPLIREKVTVDDESKRVDVNFCVLRSETRHLADTSDGCSAPHWTLKYQPTCPG